MALSNLSRLRSAGLVPWFAYVGWLVIAASQEPVLLRSYGVHLLGDASWAGAVAMLVVLLMAEPRQPMRLGWLANLCLLSGLALVQASGPLLMDLVLGRPGSTSLFLQVVGFVLCWAPFCLCYWGFAHRSRAHTASLLVPAFVLGCTHSVAIRSSEPFHGAMSASVAVVAAATWLSIQRK